MSNDYKINYVDKNEIIINDITLLKDIIENNQIVDILFSKDKIVFNRENVLNYWKMIDNYNNDFVCYIDRNISQDNTEDILSSNKELCNIFINVSEVSDGLFNFVIKYADESITKVSSELPEERVVMLIEHNLIKHSPENIQVLIDKAYYKEIILLVNVSDEDDKSEIIADLLNMELNNEIVYMLIIVIYLIKMQ